LVAAVIPTGSAPHGFSNLIQDVSRLGSVPPWFSQWRQSQAQVWEDLGLPSKKLERWKYTSLAALSIAQLRLLTAAEGDVHVDGFEQAGVRLVRLADLFSRPAQPDEAELVEVFKKSMAYQPGISPDQSLVALNAALLQDAILIDIAPKTIVAEPLTIHVRAHGFTDGEVISVFNTRVFVRIGQESEVTIAEIFDGASANLFRNSTTFFDLSKGSKVRHLRVQSDTTTATSISDFNAMIASDARLETTQVSLGGKTARETQKFELLGRGAEVKLDGLSILQGKQHIDHSTSVEHVVGHTTSEQLYKHILSGHSRAVFNGRVWIKRDAQKSMASQLNHSLSLSKNAEIDTKPELEIDADDVKASHGATVAQLDPEHLFYLRARAISEREGRHMLAKGFAFDIALRMSDPRLRDMAAPYIERKLVAMQLESNPS
jgi:Fe-S cluster assembly protein SufD